MISHRNVISNILQATTYEGVGRGLVGIETETELGLLPLSHIYGLVVVGHIAVWRGDQIIILPKFEFTEFLTAIEKYKINTLHIVPPIIIRLLSGKDVCKKYDLSSVRMLYTGAAPTGKQTVEELLSIYPKWNLCQGYGNTPMSP